MIRYGLWYPDHVYAKNHVGYKWHQVEDITSLMANSNSTILQCALQPTFTPQGIVLHTSCPQILEHSSDHYFLSNWMCSTSLLECTFRDVTVHITRTYY